MPQTAATPTGQERPLRRDAERNRQRILQGARECFATRGLGVSLDDIARHTEVGVGTVYRRFPDKRLLIEALFEEHLDNVASVLEEGLAHRDAWAGLIEALERVMEMQAADKALLEVMVGGARADGCGNRKRERFGPLLEQLVERAREQGRLRSDIQATDLPLIHLMIGSLIDATREEDPEVWRRFLGIITDGMRARRDKPTPLRVPALDEDAVTASMERWRPSDCGAASQAAPTA